VAGVPAELRSTLDSAWHAWLASVAASPTTAENLS
jgi:hypothetical protein